MVNFDQYKYIVVGAGFSGAVIAERIATVLGEKVLVIDKRNHIGGNSYSYKDAATNIEIHKYGSHIFHTSDEEVWNYVNKFTVFNQYRHTVFAETNKQVYSLPINLGTINSFFRKNFKPNEAKEFINHEINKENLNNPENLEDKAISLVGRSLYNAFIRGYTKKQWGVDPKVLPSNIITRLPVRFNYNNRYFKDKFEGIPRDGYGKMFEKILNHENIDIRLETDFFEVKHQILDDTKIIYTGPIDRFFNFKYGSLGWRTIDLKMERISGGDYQGAAVVNFTDEQEKYTRIHEFKHYHPEREQSSKETLIFKEYSRQAKESDDPYYPINTEEDKVKYKQYQEESKRIPNVVFTGRLGSYKYLDMHQVIKMALNVFEREIRVDK